MKHAMPSIALVCGLCAAHPSFAAPLDASTPWQDVAPTATVSSVVGQFAVADDAIAAATNATLQAAKEYADGAIQSAGSVTPEIVTNIVMGVAPAPGDYAAVSNAAMNAASYTDSATNALSKSTIPATHRDFGRYDVEERVQFNDDAYFGHAEFYYDTYFNQHIVLDSWENLHADSQSLPDFVADATSGLANASALADIAATVGTNTADIATIGSQVNAVGSYLNAEDAKFVSEHYDSSTRLPEAHVEVRLEDHGTNAWITIWNEMTRWGAFVGDAFDWNAWNGLHAWMTNVTAELSFKADRAWGAYDSETGGYSPEGYTQISSSNILIAAGMAYQRTVTTAGSVWILQCNTGVAHLGGDTNGFFRVMDSEGNVHFEIIKGDRRELGCDASGITVGANNVMTIPYSVDADAHPIIQCTASLDSPSWKSEGDPDCLCEVSWTPTQPWVATVTPKTAQASMFVRATYLAGAETRIRNTAPMSVEGGILCTDGIHKCRAVYNSGTIIWEVVP